LQKTKQQRKSAFKTLKKVNIAKGYPEGTCFDIHIHTHIKEREK